MISELESYVCYHLCGWRHLATAMERTAGLAESNGSLPPGGWLKVTCALTACTVVLTPGPTLSYAYGKTLPLQKLKKTQQSKQQLMSNLCVHSQHLSASVCHVQ